VHPSWIPILQKSITKYGEKIEEGIAEAIETYEPTLKILPFPLNEKLFSAFTFDIAELKVIILAQDPYIHPEEPTGMCFSVVEGVKVPPSLKNIWKEMKTDLKLPETTEFRCDLTYLRDQGILLLNASLSVLELKSNKHCELWAGFTDDILHEISDKYKNIVYLAWGRNAQMKLVSGKVNRDDNCIIEGAHPSPLSAKKFFGGRYFSRINKFLEKNEKDAIEWI
jgi:uracil-DNA glycosylase